MRQWAYGVLFHIIFCSNCCILHIVKSYPHLGYIINARMDDTEDISHREGAFIGQVNNVVLF